MRINLDVERSYYDKNRKMCTLTLKSCWKYGAGCEVCEIANKPEKSAVKTSVVKSIKNVKEINQEIDLKNIDLKEFYNFDTEPVVRKIKPAVSQIVKVGEENKEEKKEEKIVVESVKIGLFSRLKNLLFGR